MFDEPHTAYLVSTTVDKYNAKTIGIDLEFSCMIQEGSQFVYDSGQPTRLGQGVVFTSSDLVFAEGEQIKIAGITWIIKRMYKRGDNGIFHHTEIIYG